MSAAERMKVALTKAFEPAEISVDDNSADHQGHAGARPGGETHFRVRIVASAFQGLSRLDRHRRVNAVLAEEFKGRLHALQLTTLTPQEAAKG